MFEILRLLLISLTVKTGFASLYWRQYTDELPVDAISGGDDSNNNPVLIGRGFLTDASGNGGLVLIPLKLGQINQDFVWNGYYKTNSSQFIEILCGDQNSVSWVQANSKNFKAISSQNEVVVGGYNKDRGPTSIGRINSRGAINVGRVDSFDETAFLYLIDGGPIVKIETYELMVYKKATRERDSRCISLKSNSDSFCCTRPHKNA